MKNFLTILFLLFCATFYGQFIGQKLIGGNQDDHITDIRETSSGDFIAVGNTASVGAGNKDIWVMRLDPSLDTIWTKVVGGAQNEGGLSIMETATGDIVVAGFTESFGSGNRDAYILKFSATGTLLWTKVFGYGSNDLAYDIIESSDGNYVVAGGIRRTNENVMLAKIDASGNILWIKEYDRSGNSQSGHNVREMPNGDLMVTGWSWSPVLGSADIHLMRTTNNGVIRWTRALGGSNRELGMAMEVLPNGGILVAAHSLSYGSGSNDVLLYQTDSLGATVWSKAYGLAMDEFVSDIDFDGTNILVHGATTSTTDDQIYLMKLDLLGDTVWVKQYGNTGTEYRGSAIFTSNNTIVIAGGTDGSGAVMRDGLLIQADLNGDLDCNVNPLTYNYSNQGTQSAAPFTQSSISRTPTSAGSIAHLGNITTVCPTCTDSITGFPTDTMICLGDSVYVLPSISDTTGMTFTWTSTGYVSDTSAYDPYLSVSDSALFSFKASKPGCVLDSSFWIKTYPLALDSSVVNICAGDSAMIGGGYVSAAGFYPDTMLNGSVNGCDSIHVYEVITNPPAQAYDTTYICAGDSMLFGGVYVNTPGSYSDTITGGSALGCDSISHLQLNVYNIQNGVQLVDLCQGDSILIGGAYVKTQGAYNDTLTGAGNYGCDSIVVYQVNVVSPQMGSVSLSYCAGDSVQFGGVFVSSPGTYYDTLQGASYLGCDSIVQATVQEYQPVTSNVSPVLCEGDSVQVGSTWVTSPGIYSDTIQGGSTNGCDSIVIHDVQLFDPQPLIVSGDTIVCLGDDASLQASGGQSYAWNDGLKTGAQITVSPETTTTYTVVDTASCGNPQGSFTVEVLEEPILFVPDAFSPNGDGNNDRFMVQGKGLQSPQMQVFSRWGQMVFETSSLDGEWSGTHNGRPLDNGVFVYVIKSQTMCNTEIERQGKVLLVK